MYVYICLYVMYVIYVSKVSNATMVAFPFRKEKASSVIIMKQKTSCVIQSR